jgi:hypothetical protein
MIISNYNIRTQKDMNISHSHIGKLFLSPESLPFSFTYNGRRISGIPDEWRPVSKKRRMDSNLLETVYEGNDVHTGLQVCLECMEYLDYPVVEWVVWLTNRGNEPTDLIEGVLALDCSLTGTVADVTAAVNSAIEVFEEEGLLAGTSVIPSPHEDLKRFIS